MAGEQYIWGTGRRKTSIARVRIKKGNGKIVVNEKEMDSYFTIDRERGMVRLPLKTTKTLGEYDVLANVKGAGQPVRQEHYHLALHAPCLNPIQTLWKVCVMEDF